MTVLTRDRVVVDSPVASRDEAIRAAGRALIDAGAVTASYIDAMFEREQAGSTYMGNYLAIPHGTNEAKDEVLDSALVVIRPAAPIDWNGEEVRFVVGIAGKDGGHLEILSKIAIIFSEEEQVEQLLRASTADELYALLGEVNE